jgi:hypothetical protein
MSFSSPDDHCPHCQTSRSIAPNLALRHSTCCGFTLCQDCIHNKFFRGGSRSIQCPGLCGSLINEKSFSSLNLDAQRFQKETKIRAKMNKIFNAEQRDFPSESEWENYEEMVAEILYDLTYGNKNEQEKAEKRMENYKHEHAMEIERRNKRNAREGETIEKEQVNEEKIEMLDDQLVAPSGGPLVSFVLPQPLSFSSVYPTRDMDFSLQAQPESEQKRAEIQRRRIIRQNAKLAGGITEEIIEKREREEALTALIQWIM